MTEWQDEPTEAGWYWVAGEVEEGPLLVSRIGAGGILALYREPHLPPAGVPARRIARLVKYGPAL